MSVTFTRERDGQTVSADGTILGLTAMEGMDALTVEIFTEKRLNGRGEVVTGMRTGGRTATFKLRCRNPSANHVQRRLISSFFLPAEKYSVCVQDGAMYGMMTGAYFKAVKIPTQNPYKGIEVTVTMYSEEPYLYGVETAIPVGESFSPATDDACYGVYRFTASGSGSNPRVTKANGTYIQASTSYVSGDLVIIDTNQKTATKNGTSVSCTFSSGKSWADMALGSTETITMSGSNLAYSASYRGRMCGL